MEHGGQGSRSSVWRRKVNGVWWSRVKVICMDKAGEGDWSIVVKGQGHLYR